jgi:WD40 repeat protein
MRRFGVVVTALGVLGVCGHLATGQERKEFPEECKSYLKSRRWKLAEVYGSLDWKHGGDVQAAAVSPDGKLALSGGLSGTVNLFDLPSGKWVRALHEGSSWIESVGFLPDGKLAFSADIGGTIRIFDVATGKQVRSFGAVGESFRQAALSPDGKQLIAVGYANSAGALHVYDVSNGRELAQHQVGKYPDKVVVSPDGKLAALTDSKCARVLELSSGKEVTVLEGPKETYVVSLAFSPDGKKVLAGLGDGTVQVWDLAAGSVIKIVKIHPGRVQSIRFMSDDFVVSCSDQLSLKVWSLEKGAECLTLKGLPVSSVVPLSDGNRVLVSTFHALMLLDLVAKKPLGEVVGHGTELECVLHFPDGTRGLSYSGDSHCRIWDLATGKDVLVMKARLGRSRLCVSKDGKRILMPTWDDVKVFDLESKSIVATLRDSKRVGRIWFSDDGAKAIGLAESETLKEWDLKGDSEPKTLGKYVGTTNLGFTAEPTGHWGLFTSLEKDQGQRLALWDLTTAQEVRHVSLEEAPRAMAVSRDGKRAITTTYKGDVSVWDLEAGTAKTLKGHSRNVVAVAFVPDQKHVMTASEDHTIRTFGIESGGEVDSIDLSSSGDHATTLDLSEDGRSLLVGTFRGLVLRFTRK